MKGTKHMFFTQWISLFSMILIASSCYSQTDSDLVKQYLKLPPSDYFEARDSLIARAETQVTDFLPKGYVTDATKDYTKEIQVALNRKGIIVMPDFPVLINSHGLRLRDSTTLVFDKKSAIKMKPNDQSKYACLYMIEKKNVRIFYPVIEGDRDSHLSKEGEWGMGFRIVGSENVQLFNPKIENVWGDGIYIGLSNQKASEKITIEYPEIKRARRNGISVTAGNNIRITGGEISHTGGTSPEAGIDIEPNSPAYKIGKIEVDNVLTHHNEGDGIMILLANLTLKQKSDFNNPFFTEITITNHVDIKSHSGFRINGRVHDKMKYGEGRIPGEISLVNPIWIGNKYPIRYSPSPKRQLEYGFNPRVQMGNISIRNEKGQPLKDSVQQIQAIKTRISEL